MRRGAACLPLIAAVLAGCGGAGSHPATTLRPTPSIATTTARSTIGQQPVRATELRHNYVRLPVPSADLTNLVRVTGNTIAALADHGAFQGQVYPVVSTDDGGDWVIDGPKFSGGGATGPGTISDLIVSSAGTIAAWSHAGCRVLTRTTHANHWFAASFSECTKRVWARGRQIFVRLGSHRVGGHRSPGPEYVTSSAARTWHRVD